MRLSLAAAAVFLVCGFAQADEPTNNPDTNNSGAAIGIGIICNTPEQAERYISLVGAGQKAGLAMNIVNTETNNSRACGIAAVAFTRGATLDTKTVHGKPMQVVRINILAGFNGVSWQRSTGVVQYAVMEPSGIDI
jgi:hypothetical protein